MTDQPKNQYRVLVRGSGDVGSAVAHGLLGAGYVVVLHDQPQPATTRRGMAFTDAIFDGQATLEGVAARRLDHLPDLGVLLATGILLVVVVPFDLLVAALQPDVLVDARMRKRSQPEVQRGLAALTIGLGPNFVAGDTVDRAVETSWGPDLGQVISHGPTQPLAGEPRSLGGHGRERLVYAPVDGLFHTEHRIGDAVQAGEVVGSIDPVALSAPLSGRLRGLTHDGVPVVRGTKVIEVDPRDTAAGGLVAMTGIGERPGRIAAGVLQAIQEWMDARTAERRQASLAADAAEERRE
ncbi:MAG: hypothetical protein H0X37_19800 [Herpetosiphonaceae bacterium]|nr:hypothetical protein [Herpetosiphonaceae bacterium]